ncbi:MAG: ABC transporter ATP-binding protein [Gammaproteobacteria bacterium]|nr:ABC transporter ATP-binding protein [Gammaproteobacteria bacterium]
MTTPLLQSVDLCRRFGPVEAVKGISLSLRRGEVVGFLGANGAGKSTTMRLISGNLAPSHGSVTIHGYDLIQQPQQARASLGYLPEHPPLYPHLTLEEQLDYSGRLHHLRGKALHHAIERVVEQCDLQQVRQRLISQLSRGYQQRVGIAQAILHQPQLIILDEPTVGLDPGQIRGIRQLIRELGESAAVLLSTHILSEVEAVCDRVEIIDHGRQILSETVGDIASRLHRQSLLVTFTTPPSAEQLQAIPAVDKVETIAEGRFRLHHPRGESPATAIVERAVAQQWGLTALIPEEQSLESLFLRLTSEINS